MSETPKKPVEASPELTRDLNYLLNRQPSGSASPSSERPAEPPDDHADFLATQAGGFAAAKAFAENRRVSQPSPGGSGGETTRRRFLTTDEERALRFAAEGMKLADEEREVVWRLLKRAASLSGDAAPRKEPFTDAELKALRDALWQSSAAWDSCQCFRNECPHEAAYFAARKAFHDATFAGSAPRPQEGEAAALPVSEGEAKRHGARMAALVPATIQRQLVLNAIQEIRGTCSAPMMRADTAFRTLNALARIEAGVSRLWDSIAAALNAARLASPLPPRDERPCSACNGTGRLRDARPGEMRDEPDVRAASPRPGAEATSERAHFRAGHAIALHMVIELAKEAKPTGDARADANVRNSLVLAREVQQWLEPLVHQPAARSSSGSPASEEGTHE
jgi:hypothetical protein